VETQVEIEKADTKTTFNYEILLDENLSTADKDFLLNIIDLSAVKQTLSKELEFNKYE